LPSDPSQISYEDAHALARLDADWPSGSPDARLVRSVLGPVRRHHDAQQAQVELDNLKAIPARNIDHGQALSMVSAAVMREVPELTEDEAHTRARDLLTAALDKARSEHAAALDTASKPCNPTDMADSQAYREMARAAALSGDGTARRAIRDYDAAEAESAVA
jgi:outer membrane PBP1 activator LpoA protein